MSYTINTISKTYNIIIIYDDDDEWRQKSRVFISAHLSLTDADFVASAAAVFAVVTVAVV